MQPRKEKDPRGYVAIIAIALMVFEGICAYGAQDPINKAVHNLESTFWLFIAIYFAFIRPYPSVIMLTPRD